MLHEYERPYLKYYINEENRTITCKIDEREDYFSYHNLMVKKLLKHLNMESAKKEARNILIDFEPEVEYATAKCSPDDFFDIDKGKRLAYRKLCKKYQKAMLNRLFDAYNLLNVAWSAGAREYATMHDEKMHEIINRSCKRFRNLYIKKEDE